jgi:hypothetical protein
MLLKMSLFELSNCLLGSHVNCVIVIPLVALIYNIGYVIFNVRKFYMMLNNRIICYFQLEGLLGK